MSRSSSTEDAVVATVGLGCVGLAVLMIVAKIALLVAIIWAIIRVFS